jgi:uncharacterized membrane protein
MALLISFCTYFVTGLLFVGISRPMVKRRVKPNPWYGFKTPKTLSSEEIWYSANEYCGRALTVAGWMIALASIALVPLAYIPHFGVNAYLYACFIALLASLTWVLVVSFRYLQKL